MVFPTFFNTMLKGLTAYFNVRALTCSFFPGLFFWSLTVIVVLSQELGWEDALAAWAELSLLEQTLGIAGFLVWVAFWSILTTNFQDPMISLYGGNWFQIPVLSWLAIRRQSRWKSERQVIADDLEKARRRYETLEEALKLAERVKVPARTPTESLEEEVKQAIDLIKEFEPPDNPKPIRSQSGQKPVTIEGARRTLDELGEYRRQFGESLSLQFPPYEHAVMPTRLGNVLRAAELYPRYRYRLNATLLWPRLQAVLPKETVDTVMDARSSMLQMLTLSTFSVLFGLPLGLYWGLDASHGPVHWSLPIAVTGIALALGLTGLALLTLFSLFLTAAMWVPGGPVNPVTPENASDIMLRLQSVTVLVNAVILVVATLYITAVQATVGYGAHLRSAFDLHRWKILEAMHLRYPTTFEQERQVWWELSSLIASGTTPDDEGYQLLVPDADHQMRPESPDSEREDIRIPKADLPAFRPIEASDLKEESMPVGDIPIDAFREERDLVGRVPLATLPVGKPIRKQALAEDVVPENWVAMAIPMSSLQGLADLLDVGDRIEIVISRAGRVPFRPEYRRAERIDARVLDVPGRTARNGSTDDNPALRFAVPRGKEASVVNSIATGRLSIVRPLRQPTGGGNQ